MSPNTTEIFSLAELAPSSIPKIPSVSRLPKTFPMAYDLILKTTITNIINSLLKILIISPPWSFGPIATVCFRFSPKLPHVLGVVPASLPRFSTLSSLSHTFPITKFILSIICVMAACIWNLSSPSGWGGVLF